MMRGVRIAALAATLAALAVGSPAAGADTTWTKVSTDFNANIVVPSLGLTGSTAVVAWTQQTSPSTSDIDAVSFATSPTQDVSGAVTTKAAEGWASLGFTHALYAVPGGGLALAFAGIHSTNTSDPLIGLLTTQRNADGTWAAPFVVSGSSGDPWTTQPVGTIPWIAASGTVGILLFNGSVAHAPGASDQNLQPQLGGCCGYQPKLALDSAGHLWIAWYSNATGKTGMYVQQLDPATAAPMGAPALAPGSESSNNNSFGSALTCAATCRLVYGDSPAAGPTDTVVSWWPGEAAPTTIANLAGTGQGAGRVVTAAYRADGRLWVAWWDGKAYRATLGDAKGAGGLAQDAGVPKGAPSGAYALAGMAVGDNLLLAANYAWKDPASGDANLFAVFVNTLAPEAPVTKAPGPRDVKLQTGPGGKSFRIQVQYTLPKACTTKTPCALRGELRTRTGRRLYAATPLPGDTKLVLGTRGKFPVPKGAKGKIRFYISVSKAQLLKAPFSTEGGSRVAETRLRVWYTAKGSKEALSVRDGRIKVSIARIKSGALPGLSGIL
ncbi:MAG TPA: hypothetical protein VFD90_18245 [Gaiellales bacterium]|jgi:hypothetical protein|nr:hypothetical protein [Gaiellales bacterium]